MCVTLSLRTIYPDLSESLGEKKRRYHVCAGCGNPNWFKKWREQGVCVKKKVRETKGEGE